LIALDDPRIHAATKGCPYCSWHVDATTRDIIVKKCAVCEAKEAPAAAAPPEAQVDPSGFTVLSHHREFANYRTVMAKEVPGGCLVTVRSNVTGCGYTESLAFVPGVRIKGTELVPITAPPNKR
jgi:hypothetical protein